MSYRILAHPKSRDTYLDETEYTDIDTAVNNAIALVCGDDFLIVEVVDWKAVTT